MLDAGELIARIRTLAYLAMVALKLREVGDLEERLATLEQAVTTRQALPPAVFIEQGASADLDGSVVFLTTAPEAREESA